MHLFFLNFDFFIKRNHFLNKFFLGLLLVGFFVLLFNCSSARKEEKGSNVDNPLIVGTNKIMMIAHRGGAGEYPENTLLAFNHASRVGTDYLEMDVRLTLDNQLVVHHDSLIDRTSDGFGAVDEINLADLKDFNFANNFTNAEGKYPYRSKFRAQKIFTIDEIFRQFPNYKMIIEIKNSKTKGQLAASLLYKSIVKNQKQNQVIIGSFYDDVLDFFRQQSGGKVTTIAGQKETLWFYLSYLTGMEFLYERSSDLLALPTSMLAIDFTSKELITEAHRRNLAVHYWTVDDPEVMEKLISNGADGIMSNYPRLLKQIVLNQNE